jgi:hypothetical protein
MRRFLYCHFVIFILFSGFSFRMDASEKPQHQFDNSLYETVLAKYVDDDGGVNYQALKANRANLDQYAEQIALLDRKEFEQWNENDRLAFWLNAYNSLTLKLIIDNYPIKASFIGSFRFPKNSIRQISGAWDSIKHTVMGKKMTLDDIEHKVIRIEFDEPRIHFALVCAAMGCPPLRNEPYEGSRLIEQLDDQVHQMLKHPKKFKIDQSRKRVYLSKILYWYGKDFISKHSDTDKFENQSKVNRSLLNFIVPYLSDQEREFLETHDVSISYLDYDWSLNEQKN